MVLCVFIERETHNFILKFREIFPWKKKKNSARAHGMKSDENLFFCQIYVIFWENFTFCESQGFFFISEEFEDFS